jgi:hypothetical protein
MHLANTHSMTRLDLAISTNTMQHSSGSFGKSDRDAHWQGWTMIPCLSIHAIQWSCGAPGTPSLSATSTTRAAITEEWIYWEMHCSSLGGPDCQHGAKPVKNKLTVPRGTRRQDAVGILG